MKQIPFFAVESDLLVVLETVEQRIPLTYVQMDQYATPEQHVLTQGTDIPELGVANTGSASSGRSFLLAKRHTAVNPRRINVLGVERYVIDQLVNPDTVTLSPGGTWGDGVVISGRVATNSDSAPARELMRAFASAFKKHFARTKAFSVGPKASLLLNAGKRLTASEQSPHEFDLTTVP